MKFERNDKYTTIAIYALLVIICSIVFHEGFKNLGMVSGFVGRVAGYLQPITNGIVFAFLLNPLLRFLEERLLSRFALKPLSRRVAGLILTYLLAFTFVGLFSSLVAPQIFSSIQSILNNLQIYFKALEKWYLNITSFIGSFGESTEFERLLIGLLSQLLDSLRNLAAGASDYFYTLLPGVLSATQRVTTSIVNLFLGVIVSIYLLMDREKLFAQLKKILRAFTSDRSYRLITDIALDANRILSGFVLGKVIDSLIIGVLCFIGMSILRLPFAVLISFIVGITNVIPYFGPFLGAIPGALIIAVISPIQAVWFLLFILVLQQFDGNILGPKILGDSIGLSPLWIILSIMLFSGLLGVVGMFIGVPLFAIIYSLVKRFVTFLLERKGESPNTWDYASPKNPRIK
ncbi:MAG: AI-2E family transporter [Oscillospiraceae bacterium]|jgi:predicted PurR-regulated permease PerM